MRPCRNVAAATFNGVSEYVVVPESGCLRWLQMGGLVWFGLVSSDQSALSHNPFHQCSGKSKTNMSSEKTALLSNSHDEIQTDIDRNVTYGSHGNSTTLNNDEGEYYGNQVLERSGGDINQINLSWENINITVHMKSENKKCCRGGGSTGTKRILKSVSGMVKPGRLLAIMGASGAGKSTLMNVLTGRNINQYQLEGQIKINGIEVGRGIKNISAYCQQDELFISTLTVREHLQFR
ncbi:hypothetical protein LOTGIDRAFT_170902, partial [Lottia gigantea]